MTIFSQIYRSISETVIVRWAHTTRQFVSIEISFHPYNIQRDCPRGNHYKLHCSLARFDQIYNFCRAMLCKRGLCRHAVSVRPYVCPSVTFVDSVERNKRIFKIFSPSDRPFQFFRTKRHGNIPTGTILTGASNAGGVDRNRDSEPISGSIACCQRCDRLGVINTTPPDRGKLTLIAGSKRQRLLMTTNCL